MNDAKPGRSQLADPHVLLFITLAKIPTNNYAAFSLFVWSHFLAISVFCAHLPFLEFKMVLKSLFFPKTALLAHSDEQLHMSGRKNSFHLSTHLN